MSEPIKAGDLVMIVHSCCGMWLGLPFTVDLIVDDGIPTKCDRCGQEVSAPTAHNRDGVQGRLCWWPLKWLKRIPPLTEPDSVEKREEIHA